MVGLKHPPRHRPTGAPVIDTLAARTRLFRVHGDAPGDSLSRRAQPLVLSRGRFDSHDGSYGSTYLGDSPDAAIAETVCRDLPLVGAPRLVPRRALEGRRLSTVDVTRDLAILVLHGPALTQVGATLAVTTCEADGYEVTRAWARSLRAWFPEVAGFRYRCRHDENRMAWVLFDDGSDADQVRARGAIRAMDDGFALTSAEGLEALIPVLHAHNATFE